MIGDTSRKGDKNRKGDRTKEGYETREGSRRSGRGTRRPRKWLR